MKIVCDFSVFYLDRTLPKGTVVIECGKLLHMREAESEDVLKLIFGDCNFSVDREQTTLFGCCGECRQKEK